MTTAGYHLQQHDNDIIIIIIIIIINVVTLYSSENCSTGGSMFTYTTTQSHFTYLLQ